MVKYYKWLILVMMALFVLLTAYEQSAIAETGVIYANAESGLNLRAGPSIDSKILAKLEKGFRMVILDYKDPWIKVGFEVRDVIYIGWVHSAFVSKIDPTSEPIHLDPVSTSDPVPLTPTNNPTYSYKEVLSDESMQRFALRILRIIIQDGRFLYSMHPDDHLKALMGLKYEPDRVGVDSDNFKPPSKTYLESGDCEDLTIYTVAWGLLSDKDIGIIWFSPESIDTSDKGLRFHIAAVGKFESDIMIVDCSVRSDDLKILPLNDYFEKLDMSAYTRYRIWWLFKPNSEQGGIKRIPQ